MAYTRTGSFEELMSSPNVVSTASIGGHSNHPYAMADKSKLYAQMNANPGINSWTPDGANKRTKLNHDGSLTEITVDEDGNEIKGSSSVEKKIKHGRVYDPTVFDDVRSIIEPFKDLWQDPGIVVGPDHYIVPNTDPPLTPNPKQHSHVDVKVGPTILGSETGKDYQMKKHIEEMPEPIQVYMRKTVLDLSKWINVSIDGLQNEVDGKLNGQHLETTVRMSATAVHMNLKNNNYTAIDTMLDKSHESVTPAMEKFTILAASSEANIKGVNMMMGRMEGSKLDAVIDEVTANIMKSVETASKQNISAEIAKWVDRMADYPDWSAKAMLKLPDEYNPHENIKELLGESLERSKGVRDSGGNVMPTVVDEVSDNATEMTDFQMTAALVDF